MYNNILIPLVLDENHSPDNALAVARAIAADGAKITLFHVIEELPGYAKAYVTSDFLENSTSDLSKELERLAETLPGGQSVVTTGHSARSILDYAENNSIDCVIVSSHKPGVQDYFLGGTAARVVRYSQCAVHVIR
ncbi:MAG: universal stress protein [Pseudomonadota bacterium]